MLPRLKKRLDEPMAALVGHSREARAALEDLAARAQELGDTVAKYGVEPDQLATYLVEKLDQAGADPDDFIEAARSLPVDELLLGLACSLGNANAIAEFEKRFFTSIRPALGRMNLSAAAMDEIEQMLREKLFVAEPGRRARIAELVGQGDLRALVRVMAVRVALNLKRRDHRLVPDSDDAILEALAPGSDPEMATLKERYREQVQLALVRAIAGLEDKQRAVLRLHLLHGLSIDEIGAIYRVHRATAARWLSRLRSQLERDTRSELHRELGVDKAEFESLVRLVQSRLDVSFDRLLQSMASEPED